MNFVRSHILVCTGTGCSSSNSPKIIEAFERELKNVTVTQTGCIGVCRLEPIAEVYVPGEEKVTYVKLTPEKVPRIVSEHLVNHSPVVEYTIGAAE